MTDKEKIQELIEACKSALMELREHFECVSEKYPYPDDSLCASAIKQVEVAIKKAEGRDYIPMYVQIEMIKNGDDLRDIRDAASTVLMEGQSFRGSRYYGILIRIPEEQIIAFH